MKPFLTQGARLLLLILLGTSYSYAAANIYITAKNGETMAALGDTVTFQVWIDPMGANLTGYEFYLSFDPATFKPIFADIDTSISEEDTVIVYRPFTPGNLISLGPIINHTHDDEWSEPYVDVNDITGFQLDYFQRTPVAPPGGQRQYFSGEGVAATFDLVVIGIPSDPSSIARITIDNQYVVPGGGGRQTRYYLLGSAGTPSDFASLVPFEILISGLQIMPVISDTLIIPGSSHTIYLSDHFTSGLYDSSQAVWNVTYTAPPGATVFHDAGSAVDSVYITTTGTTHGVIDLTVALASPEPIPIYTDTQQVQVIVDYPPIFDQDLSDPQLFTFDEDTQLSHSANADIGGLLFTDLDDTGPNLSIWLEPDSRVHLSYDDVNTVTFSADTNWFGTRAARLYVEDALGISIDTLLTFTVNSINDAPVVNLDSVGALGDTLIVHRVTPDTLDLLPFVTDPDDTTFSWSVINPETNLSATPLAGDRLRLEAGIACPFSDIDLILTATDDSSASSSDTLVVSVRSWSPEIGSLPDIRILAGTPDTLSLNELVTDNDTPDASMTWTFAVVSSADSVTVDPQVTVTYNQPAQIAIFDTPTGYFTDPTDLLILTVEDDDNNTDTDTTRLAVFDSDAPMIFPLPSLTVYRDSIHTGVIDLDDYVADLEDDPEDIEWDYFGGDSLADFDIDWLTHEVSISTGPIFIGYQTVSLIATNRRGLKDTSDLVILVSRLVDGPPIWYAVDDPVEVVFNYTTDLFTFSEICFDETPTDQIIFTPFYEADSLTVTVVAPDSVKLTTPISTEKYNTWLYFSAEDDLGLVSYSDIISVEVKDSFSPVWERIPTIILNVSDSYSGLFLNSFISDRDTPTNLITFSVVSLSQDITVSYDPITTEIGITSGVRASKSWLFITATDDKSNIASISVQVIVRAVPDFTPPDGNLTYFFNSAADRWIHYVAVADSTTDISRFKWDYSFGSPPRDYSDSLVFTMKDSLPGTLTWIAPYNFHKEGTYFLSIELTDAVSNLLEPVPSLTLSVGFAKVMGSILKSPDQQLTASYPQGSVPDGSLLIIAEEVRSELSDAGSATAPLTKMSKEDTSPLPNTLYSLDANLHEPVLVTITYNQNPGIDPYYSFYEVDSDGWEIIETYASEDGRFEAATTPGKDIVFARSDIPARSVPLPNNELLCYPNPFNATIQVRFMLGTEDQGRIVIYNLLGQQVFASPAQQYLPGVHPFSWHGIDDNGFPVPSGMYFIRLETQKGRPLTQKVTLLK